MRDILKAAAILLVMVLLTGCQAYETHKQSAVQTVTAAFLSPFVDAQRTTPLTQGTFKATPTVAAQSSADKPVAQIEKPRLAIEPVKEPVSKCTCEIRRERRERRS